MKIPESIDATATLLEAQNYVPERQLATAVFLSLTLRRPLLVEGEPGTGKTELAKALASALGSELIRLQCYEGLDVGSAAYEWNYARQMLEIRLAEATSQPREQISAELFSERFLIARPLLRALESQETRPVLLIDELDRSDEPFEAYLLEVLSDYQISIPEWTTIVADEPPIVVITSNRTREIHDAVKRRCLYHWIDYPNADRELEIVRRRVPGLQERLSRQVVTFVQSLRAMSLYKPPGVSETIEWARALDMLNAARLESDVVDDTLGVLLKYQDDLALVRGAEAERLVNVALAEAPQ